MKSIIKLSLFSLIGIAGVGYANSFRANMEVGTTFSQLSSSQYMSPVAGLVNEYSASQPVQIGPFLGMGIEYDFDHVTPMPLTFGLGLSAYYIDLGSISGTEWPAENILSSPDPLNYSMNNQAMAVMIEPKMIYSAHRLQPYVWGGVGCTWNSLNDYTETTPPGSSAAPAESVYASHTVASFAYEVGAGVQYALWQGVGQQMLFLKAEYRYFNLGQAELGLAPNQTTNNRIAVNSAANIIDMGVSYQFE